MKLSMKTGIVAIAVGIAGFLAIGVPSLHASGGSCSDTTSIILCGASSKSEILSAYDSNTRSAQTIYSYMGISRGMIANADLVSGTLYRNGDVFVNGQKVATGARTAGHNWGSGYSQVKIPGTSDAYSYTTGALVRDTRPVLVSMAGGAFQFAVMTECGNPIVATPVPQPVYSCDTLTPSTIDRAIRRFTIGYTARNGAAATAFNFTWGDGTSETWNGAIRDHTYAKPGTYTVTASVTMTVNGQTVVVGDGGCHTTVTISPEMCTVPGKTQYPKDDPRCVEDKPAVSITKTVNNTEHIVAKVGETFTYQITVKNTGNVVLKDAKVTDTAPAQVTLLTASEGTVSGSTWNYTISELAVGASRSFTVTAKYGAYAAGTHVNTVCVDTPTVPGTPDDCDDASTETFTPGTPTPPVLPHTGVADTLMNVVGAGGLVGATLYFVTSRRALR